jgi:hypothetical protein
MQSVATFVEAEQNEWINYTSSMPHHLLYTCTCINKLQKV